MGVAVSVSVSMTVTMTPTVTMASTMTMAVAMAVTMAVTSGSLLKSFILYLDCCSLDSKVSTFFSGFQQNSLRVMFSH